MKDNKRKRRRLTRASAPPVSGSYFNDIGWRGDSHDRDSSTKNESGNSKLCHSARCARNHGTDDDDTCAAEHSPTSTISIRDDCCQGRCYDCSADSDVRLASLLNSSKVEWKLSVLNTYTEYSELIMETWAPSISVPNSAMKVGMAVIEPIREPS